METITLTHEGSNGLHYRPRIDGVPEAINYIASDGIPLVDWPREGGDPLPLIDRDAYACDPKVPGIEPLIEL
jgi:hypothetical protein